jgi:signal transduction histidine kinase
MMSLLSTAAEPRLTEYRIGTLFLLCMAALAFEPLRQQIQETLGRRLLRHRIQASDLAAELATQEARADQAQRLAELGAFTSAVAHEVRNPLGVLSAHCRVLERSGANPDALAAMREQIARAERFVDDLLRYGRPRPLELRLVDLRATTELALSTARGGLGESLPRVEVMADHADPAPLLEADQAQLSQALVVLFENALLALDGIEHARIRVTTRAAGERVHVSVEDSGPGIPEDLAPRLFQPFVTGRKRSATRSGTGLGLAIARGIVERHRGTIRAGRSDLGGARFDVELPRYQGVLAAASAVAEEVRG